MNVTSAMFLNKNSHCGGPRIIRASVAIVSIFLLTAVPVLADTVRINQVVQTLTSSPGTPDLKINTLLTQDPGQTGSKASTPQSGPRNDAQASNQGGAKTDSVLSGVSVSGGQQLGVDIIEEGEVEGTICDCGEVLVAGGAFPKWPFLFLAAVPFIFIHDCNDCDQTEPTPTPTPTPPTTPTPTPTPPGVPEPATLFLFGTGLAAFGAGLRRRYAKTRFAEQMNAQEEE